MVEIEKEYYFDGTVGKESLLGLFKVRSQLIEQHFRFDPDWNEGCKGCSFQADNIGHLAHLHTLNVTLELASRAPLYKLENYNERMSWTLPWYSSYKNDFNYDFQVTVGNGSDYNRRNL